MPGCEASLTVPICQAGDVQDPPRNRVPLCPYFVRARVGPGVVGEVGYCGPEEHSHTCLNPRDHDGCPAYKTRRIMEQ